MSAFVAHAPLRQRSTVAAARVCSARAAPPHVPSLVDSLLRATRHSDVGTRLTPAQRRDVERTVRTLNQIGSYRRNPLSDASIFANYSVLYTSRRKQSPAAGGGFRSAFARLFLRSTGLFQHLLPPDVVVNLVCFRIAGVVPGCVSLKGTFTPVREQPNAVRVHFQRPRIRIGNAVFEFGSPSSVQLAATYLDERLRLGVGGRGSLFVFANDEAAQSALAQQWKYMFEAKAHSPLLLLGVALLLAAALWLKAWPARVGSLLATGALWFILNRRQA